MSGPKPELNRKNLAALAKWAREVSEQARVAVEAMQPRTEAAFASLQRAMKRPAESDES